ncbi:hypothetical protein EBH_0000780 [Eimeria brunetti]|uniref:Uncharacterized protein n=1 Tax=Eimeria brunetti TaxID=51314 RepID=U6LMV8_9EIME|nr:hypothetical protein EBH_0000780 [Eimeria brunetti]
MTLLDPQLQPPLLASIPPSRNAANGGRRLLQRSPRSSRNLFAGAAVAAAVSLVMLVAVFAACQSRFQRPLSHAAKRRRLSYTEDDGDELSSILEQCLDFQEEHGFQLPVSERVDEREAKQRLVAMLHASAAAFEQRRVNVPPQSQQREGRLALRGAPQSMHITAPQPPRTAVWRGPAGAATAPVRRPTAEGVVSSYSKGDPYADTAFASQQTRAHASSQSLHLEGPLALYGAPQRMYMPIPQISRTAIWGGPNGAAVAPAAGRTPEGVASFSPGEHPYGTVAFVPQRRRAHVASERVQYEGRFARSGAPHRMYTPTPQLPRMAVWGGPSGAAVAAARTAGGGGSFAAEENADRDATSVPHAHSSAPYDTAEAFSAAMLATIGDGVDAAAEDNDDASTTQLVGLTSVSPDNASAAALSADAWLAYLPTVEFPSVAQQWTKATETSLAAADEKGAASLGHMPPRPPEQMDGKQQLEAISGPASGVPASASSVQIKRSSEGNDQGSMEDQGLALHPFVRLPAVDPQDVRRYFRTAYALTLKLNIVSPMHSFMQMRKLFAKPSLTAEEVETLMFEAENLANYAKDKLRSPFSIRKPSYTFRKLSSLFMVFDYLMCTIETLGDKMLASSWWDEFASKFETEVTFVVPSERVSQQTRKLSNLVNRISEALSIYKQGRRPPLADVIELKRGILMHQYKGSQLRHPLWMLWLKDDDEFLRSRGRLSS